MIDLRHPLATRIPWTRLETALAPRFARSDRPGVPQSVDDLFGGSLQIVGGGVSAAGRPRRSMRLMLSLLYLRGKFKSLTAQQRRWLKRRQAVEPAIGQRPHGQ